MNARAKLALQVKAGDIKEGTEVVVVGGWRGKGGKAIVESVKHEPYSLRVTYQGEKTAWAEPSSDTFAIKPAKVTVGHNVKITEYGNERKNEIGKIVQDDNCSCLTLLVKFKDGPTEWFERGDVEYVAPYELDSEPPKEEEETADMLKTEETAKRRPTKGDKVMIVSGPYVGETGTILYDDHDSEPYKVHLLKGDRTNWLREDQVALITDEDFRPFVDVLKDVVDGKYENGSVIETDNNKEFLVGDSLSGFGLCLPNTHSASIQLGSNLLNSKARVKPAPKQLSKEAAEKELTEKFGTPVKIKD